MFGRPPPQTPPSHFAESRQPGYPLDKGGSGGGKKVNKESIESIKDPAKRIMARAAHMDLYK